MLVQTMQDLADFDQWLDAQSVIAVDTETTGLDPYGTRQDRICGLAVYAEEALDPPDPSEYAVRRMGQGFYIPYRHDAGTNSPLGHLQATMRRMSDRCNAGDLTMLFWNAKFDLHMMIQDGFELPRRTGVEDYMLAFHLLNENEPSFALKSIADKYRIGTGSLDESALKRVVEEKLHGGKHIAEKSWKGDIYRLSGADVHNYALSDVWLTWEAAMRARTALDKWKLAELFADMNTFLLIVARMERRGFKLDRERIDEHMATSRPLFEQVTAEIREIVIARQGHGFNPMDPPEQPISEKTGKPLKWNRRPFNPGSPKQLQIVFDWPSTDKPYLESLDKSAPDYEIANKILDWRVLDKMKGTYYDAYLSLIDPEGTLRPNYNLHGTVTGRISCSRPNLANVPRYSEKRKVKDVFVARDGYLLFETDYRAAELRIACHFAQEWRMAQIILDGRDPHGETASGIGLHPVNDRHVGKTLNFLVIYGGGVRALTKLLKCDEQTAADYLGRFRNLYPGFARLSDEMEQIASTQGFIRYPTGRIRRFNTYKIAWWEAKPRKAMNSYIQGTSSEMMRVAMMRLDAEIERQELDAHFLIQVYDSLMIEVREDHFERLRPLMRPIMTGFHFTPPPDIEAKLGTRWGQLKEIEI
jgi:DNA polymerase-1